MKKMISFMLAICLSLGILAGCGGDNDQNQGAQTPQNEAGEESDGAESGAEATASTDGGGSGSSSGKDTLVIATNADIYSMDPQLKKDVPSARIKIHVFDTLVYLDSENNVMPGLAESWEFIDDTTIHFKIRDGVTFHNGDALTMEDILFSFERGEDAPQTSTTMEPIDIANCKAVDGNIFEMKLKYPYGAILTNLTDTCCSIVSKSYVEEIGDDEFALNPIGTGPYTFENWVSGDRTELARYDGYWGDQPYFKNMVFRVITESANRAIELETGNVDISLDIAPADLANIEGNPALTLERGPNFSVTYMAMNNSKAPFDNVKVRQAISLALDLPAIVGAVYEGTGDVGRGPMTPTVYGFDESLKPVQQDIEAAKALLAEAGFPDGFSCSILTSDHQQRMDFCEIAQNQLAQIGIDCEVNIMEWGAYLDAVFAGEHEMTVLGFSYGVDPGVGLYNLFSSDSFGPDGNISWYSNARVDELLEAAKTEMDSDAREAMFHEIQNIVVEEAPWVFIWQGENLNGTNKDLRGFKNYGSGYYRFMETYYE